tara:strand:- start:681 stop:1043 length:363 start_codon:yes stop_codon:yes gene_type:complete
MEKLMLDKTSLFYIVEQEVMPSRHGGYITEIKMISMQNGEYYHTYVDENNRNYKHWYEYTNHPQAGYIISNLKLKKDNLISADSRPHLEKYLENQQELERFVVDYLDRNVYGLQETLFQY